MSSASGFWTELKRRKVFRVAVVYAATAFVVLQAADIMLPRLAVPDWGMSLVVVLAVLGFPVALVLGWAFELTPDGVRATTSEPAAASHAAPSLLGRRTAVMAGALVVLGVALGAGWVLRPGDAGPAPAGLAGTPVGGERSIAVLPFDNYSPDPGDAYFAGAITEEITNQLSRLSDLSVTSRTAVSRALESDRSLAEIAAELRVANILEGSVLKAGDRVRITTQLIDTRDSRHVWSRDFDRDLADVFAIQREVALAIVDALRAELTPADRQQIAANPTEDLAAYQLYLRARQMQGNVPEENRVAVELLRQAVALDPHFEKAWSALAWRYQWETYHGDDDGPAKALEYSAIALDLDASSAEAHTARAAAYIALERNAEARAAFARALELEPDNGRALADGSLMATRAGDLAEGVRTSLRGVRTAPNVPNVRYHVAVPLLNIDDDRRLEAWLDLADAEGMEFHRLDIVRIQLDIQRGDTARALARTDEAMLRWSGHPEFRQAAADVRLFLGDPTSARAELEHRARTSPDRGSGWVSLRTPRTNYAFLLAQLGERERADRQFDEALRAALAHIEGGSDGPHRRIDVAAVLVFRGDRDGALEWLERAYAAGARMHRLLAQDPMFASIRDDDRFRALLARMSEAKARERARYEAEGTAAAIDAMVAAGGTRPAGASAAGRP